MNSHTHYLTIHTKQEKTFVNITHQVEQQVQLSGIQEGLCLVNSMHITSSVFINDEEEGLKHDFMQWLEDLAPDIPSYEHHHTGEDNADAHLKRTIMGREVVVAITKGKLDLGPWEQLFYGEFDGKRDKKVLIKLLGV
ncbi:MAG: secondary thiamine-phosphate synthase enzyme YjbQ [Candidatus Woesearchaeota archaeon]